MSLQLEAIIPTSNGAFLIRDVSADTVEAQRPASEAARIPGSRGGRMFGAAGPVLLIRCAHQYGRPSLRITTGSGPAEPEWQREAVVALSAPTGRICLDAGDNDVPSLFAEVALAGGPGIYPVEIWHAGRQEMRAQAAQVQATTLYASTADTMAAWRGLDGLERYLLRIASAPQREHPARRRRLGRDVHEVAAWPQSVDRSVDGTVREAIADVVS
ncbi:hypothetical protein AB0F81_06510 [Actinoplanes sp. NPDC024001]|uniref:hypothetical protein n=1 Tax=Actinoplanes sp. NPDC024001 TaxID=3154598 RepID=UPI0033CAD087